MQFGARVAVTTSSRSVSRVLAATKPRRARFANALNLLWVLPVLALLAGVLVYPLASGFLLSLQRTTCAGQGEFIGPGNYVEAVFRDDIFHQAVSNTVAFTLLAIVLQTGVGLLLAILISELRRGRLPYRMIFFAPVVLSAAAVGSVWQW